MSRWGSMAECFQVERADNVATLLQDADAENVAVRGQAEPREVRVSGSIKAGHKVALCAIAMGAAVVKYGVTIGTATRAIAEGEWVHLHNCRSLCDELSSSLDAETGAREATTYV